MRICGGFIPPGRRAPHWLQDLVKPQPTLGTPVAQGCPQGPWGWQGPAPCGGACGPGRSEPRSTCSFLSTCSRGKWTCRDSAHCSSTCTLYGEGHVVTFDGQRFVFQGNCEYILATVRAGGGQVGGGATGAGRGRGHRGRRRGGPAGAAQSSWLAPPQHSLPTGRLRCQRLPVHLQDPDGECGVREVRRHLLPGHQSLPGGEQAGRRPHTAASVPLAPRKGQRHLPELNSHTGWEAGSPPRSLSQPSVQCPR